jgi:hypothetical protein
LTDVEEDEMPAFQSVLECAIKQEPDTQHGDALMQRSLSKLSM